jgi:hypothetical protein
MWRIKQCGELNNVEEGMALGQGVVPGPINRFMGIGRNWI